MNWISVLIKKKDEVRKMIFLSFTISDENAMKNWPPANEEESSHETPNLLAS